MRINSTCLCTYYVYVHDFEYVSLCTLHLCVCAIGQLNEVNNLEHRYRVSMLHSCLFSNDVC